MGLISHFWTFIFLLRPSKIISLGTRRSNQSILKEINPEDSLEGLNAEAEALVLWLPDAKSQLIEKDPDAGKDWGQEEKGATEDEMVR